MRLQANSAVHTLLTIRAAEILGQKNPSYNFYLTGECTDGPYNRSTDQLERDYLVRRGTKEGRITAIGNLNDTGAQIEELRDHAPMPLIVVCLQFHRNRVVDLMHQMYLPCKVVTTEEILLEKYPHLSAKKLQLIIASNQTILGISKVYVAEAVMNAGTSLGKPGRLGLRVGRIITRQNGPTITDKNMVGPASKLWPQQFIAKLPPH